MRAAPPWSAFLLATLALAVAEKAFAQTFSGDFSQPGGAVYQSPSTQFANAIAVDTQTIGGPYVYVTGGRAGGGSGVTVKYSSAGVFITSGTFDNDPSIAHGIVVDAAGSVWVAGQQEPNGSTTEWVVAKFDANLVFTASHAIVGTAIPGQAVSASGIVLDAAGNAYAVGNSSGPTGQDFLIVKYSPAMVVLASTTFDSGAAKAEFASAAAFDSAGNLFVTGISSQNGNYDFLTVKFDPALTFLSSATFNPYGFHDLAKAVSIDPSNNVYVTGSVGTGSDRDFTTVKYDSSLVMLASTSLQNLSLDQGLGSVFVGTDTLITVGWDLVQDFMILEHASSLVLRSSRREASGNLDWALGVARGTGTYIYVTGATNNNSDYRTIRVDVSGNGAFFPVNHPGCAVTKNVGAGQTYGTIQSAVDALPASLTGPACIVIRDGAAYAEQVTVRGFANNGYSISILADPASGLTPVVAPPAASAAAFLIANASVNVMGIDIVPTAAMPYGIFISSAYVSISSVNVKDAAGRIATAGVALSSWTTVTNTSVTVGGANASGFWLQGISGASVSRSTAAANASAAYALRLTGASSNTLSDLYLVNLPGIGAQLVNSNGNTISRSSIACDNGTGIYAALYLSNSSSNTVTRTYVRNSYVDAIGLRSGSNYNTISQSTAVLTGAGGQAAIGFSGSHYNAVAGCMLTASGGLGINLGTSNFNAVGQTTMSVTNGTGRQALMFNVASSNTVTQCYIADPQETGISYFNGSNYNAVSLSVIVGGASSNLYPSGVYLQNGAYNTITQSVITNPGGFGAAFGGAAQRNTISLSTITSGAAGQPGVYFMSGSGTNTVTGSYVQGSTAAYIVNVAGAVIDSSVLAGGALGPGIFLDYGSSGTIVLAGNSITGALHGLRISTQSASLSVSSISFTGLAPGATAIHFLGGTFVTTMTAASFGASVSVNVDGSRLSPASRVTMSAYSGARVGPGYENDPNGVVDWPAPPVAPVFSAVSIAPSSGIAGTNPAATVVGDLFDGTATLALERGTGPGTWANTGAFGNSRKLGTLTKLADGRVLLAGGEKQTSTNGLANADIFNPLTGTWTAAPPMLQGRTRFTALLLGDGRVLVAGGLGPTGGPLPSVEIFDPVSSTWTPVAAMSHIRWGHRMVALADGRLLVAGGNDGAVSLDTAEIYDPVVNSWSAAGTMSATRENATLTLLRNGKALVVGGPSASADLYDPGTNAWSPAGTMSYARKDHQAALLPDGRVLVSAGRFATAVATAEIYDPLTNSWTAAGSLTGRYEHAMVMVDGAPVILGGYSGASSLSSTQIYDAELNTWRAGPNLPGGRRNALAVALDDGRFLTASGASGSFTISVLNTAALLTMAQSSIAAAGLASADAQHLSGTFDLNGATTGYWNVVVRKPGPLTARLDGGFKVYVGTPAAPSGFAGTAVSSAAILWTWTDNSFDETGFSVMSGTISVSGPLPVGTTTWLQQGLPPDTAFGPYTVQASNSGGTADSGPAARSTLPAPPDAAGAPAGNALGVSSVAWTWSLASGASSYNLFRSSDNGFLASASSAAFTQTSLAPNTAYGLRTAGVNISGTGPLSASATVYTLAADPAGTGTTVTSTTLVASWTLNGNPASTVAELLRSTDAVVYSTLTVAAVTSYVEADLLGCTTYYYRVRNLNGDGLPTAYASFSGVTANTDPSPPSGLTAAANAGGTVGLSWALSPTEGVTGYRLYWDAGTGTVSYAAPLATLGGAATGYTTAVLTSSASYTFALRAAHRCGTVETAGALAMSGAAAALPAVRAAVKEPDSGRRINGNRVTVLGELLYGTPSDVQQVVFQYKPAADSVWLDVPAANVNHGNPDLDFPYFVHWDVTALAAGDYDLRAVAYDRAGVPDPAPPAVRVAVDPVTPDIDEGTTVDGKIKKKQTVANTVTSVVDTAGAGAADPAVRVTIPAGVVTSATATVSVIANPSIATAAPSGQSLVGSAIKIDLSNGQTALNGTAEISLTYPQTVQFPSRLQIYYLDEVNGRWTRDFTSTVDTASRTVTGRTPHFSTFAIMLGAAFSPNLDSVQAYPVPFKPNGSNPDEGRPFSHGDANSGIIFANLASGSEIRIYTLSGRLVSSLDSPAASGTLRWDARNQDGRDVASGAYFAVISAPGQKSVIKKLVIIR